MSGWSIIANFFQMLLSLWGNAAAAAAAAKSILSCPTLCDPINSSPPGYTVPGILQARTLEWVAISFSNAWKWKVKVKSLSRVRLFATLWTAAHQVPPSMGFSRQEYWSGLPLPSPHCEVIEENNLSYYILVETWLQFLVHILKMFHRKWIWKTLDTRKKKARESSF